MSNSVTYFDEEGNIAQTNEDGPDTATLACPSCQLETPHTLINITTTQKIWECDNCKTTIRVDR